VHWARSRFTALRVVTSNQIIRPLHWVSASIRASSSGMVVECHTCVRWSNRVLAVKSQPDASPGRPLRTAARADTMSADFGNLCNFKMIMGRPKDFDEPFCKTMCGNGDSLDRLSSP
jgi:hypothetical protein